LTPAQKTTLIKRYTQTDLHIMLLHDHLVKFNLWYGGTLSGILLYLFNIIKIKKTFVQQFFSRETQCLITLINYYSANLTRGYYINNSEFKTMVEYFKFLLNN